MNKQCNRGLVPIAPCGRSSLQYLRKASIDHLQGLMNQWAFRHSARKRPLKASMNALSVGLRRRSPASRL
jgi:hypothetical protein